MDKFIPLSIPNFEGNERKYVDDAIDDLNSEVWTFTLTSDNSTVTKTVLLR